ncbi:hypothetical protein [Protaetiibacter intestinalis]|uniref:Uncharacterized protein n=1 Tax=Protaetiibacter intestinalis TaxID=2419774 RepID=A0A387BKA0_9MICO|nr:hypothetical protein [Protaetiibacter intestinalis]AYF98950.1 hypothetical protein D7I47_12275 [Protaetiibacter intestinalis]
MSAPDAAGRVLQPAAWRRAIAPMVIAVVVLSIVLQEPVAALLPPATPRVLVFLAIAVPVVLAIVLGLAAAYPRIVVLPDGALRLRGVTVRPAELVTVRRSVSSGGGAGYLVLTFRTAGGRRIRVLVAGAPIRGLDTAQARLLWEAVAASGIPAGADAAQERGFLSENVLASGRQVEVDRGLVLRELDGLLGVPHQVPEVAAVQEEPPAASSGDDDVTLADDRAAAAELLSVTRGTRLVRRIAFWTLVLACVVTVIVLLVLLTMEWGGRDFGAFDEDPLTAVMTTLMLVSVLFGIVWAVAADVDDARVRASSRRWLAAASVAQGERGLPTPFHAAWLGAPGGRMAGVGLFVLGMVALLAVIGGPVALARGYGPPAVGVLVTIAGVVLGVVALWGWFSRRRAHRRRVEWLIEVAGERATGGQAPDAPFTG